MKNLIEKEKVQLPNPYLYEFIGSETEIYQESCKICDFRKHCTAQNGEMGCFGGYFKKIDYRIKIRRENVCNLENSTAISFLNFMKKYHLVIEGAWIYKDTTYIYIINGKVQQRTREHFEKNYEIID